MQAKQNLLQEFFGIELVLTGIVVFEFLLDEVVKIGENRIVLRRIRLKLVRSVMPNFWYSLDSMISMVSI